jgi:hypothetical protein
MLSSPDYDKTKALGEQKQLLKLKKQRLERLISAIDQAMKGENVMKAFDNTEYETYKTEVQQRWGNTDAYREHAEKTKHYSKDKFSALAADMDLIFGEFALCMKNGGLPEEQEAQELVKKLQNHITDNYYTCTKPILSGLGQMYVADERFQNNIDRHGDGTADFVSQAIACFCAK